MADLETSLLRAVDLIGVGVFAASGALAAGRKRLDLLGVAVIAVVTAIGGGTLRDVLLGRLPVFWVRDPIYLPVIVGATALTILYTRFRRPPERVLLLADAIGLALFSISGAQIARTVSPSPIVLILMGTISGTAGGIVRDVLCNEIPLIFQSGSLYATTAIVGTAVYALLPSTGMNARVAAFAGMIAILVLRLAAIFTGLRLPVYHVADASNDPKP